LEIFANLEKNSPPISMFEKVFPSSFEREVLFFETKQKNTSKKKSCAELKI